MTLLQDFDYLGRGRGRASQGALDSLDTLDSLAHTATALLTASARRRTQAGTGHIRHRRDLKVLCVEEDSGYQTSENENENENGSGALDLGYERKQGLIRHSLGYHGAEILDLSCQSGENGITTDRGEEIMDSAYEMRGERRFIQSFSHHEVEILNLSSRREERGPTRDRTEENFDLEQERRTQNFTRRPFNSNGGELLDLPHEIRKRKTNGNSFSEDSEHFNLANVRREHERLQNILMREHLNAEIESRKRELDPLSVEIETDSGHRRIKRRRTEKPINDEDEDVSSLEDEEQEERVKRRTGDSIHGEAEDVLSSGHETTERRRTGDDTREEDDNISSLVDEEQEERTNRRTVDFMRDQIEHVLSSGHEKTERRRTGDDTREEVEDISSLGDEEQEERTNRRTVDFMRDQIEDVLSSGHERTERRTGNDTREEVEDILTPEDEGKEEKAEEWDSERERTKRITEDSVSDPADDISNPDDEEDKIKTEPETEEALTNPLAATSTHSRLLCCNNGFFRATGETQSVFESNCGCTTHNLVDWRTRVTWTDPNLLHQVRVREVTVLSPFRTPAIPWGLPVSPWRSCPTPQSSPQPQHPLPLPQTPVLDPQPSASEPQQPLRVKKEEMEDDKSMEGDRGYRCGQVGCGRTFCRNEELTRHLRIHSGQRPFVCQRCGRRFVRRDHLTKHQRTHLPAHVKRSYTCPLPACTHRYTRSDALTRHMWTAHHLRARQPTRGRREPREEPELDPKK